MDGNTFKEIRRLEKLRELRNDYYYFLGDFFSHKSIEHLAIDYLNPEYRDFVEDYVSICIPEFREKYEKSKQFHLESKAQTSPKFTPSKETKQAADKFINRIKKGVITERPIPSIKTTEDFDIKEASKSFDSLVKSKGFLGMMKGAYKR